ncbi:MAG: hypothetical protein Q8O86_13050 [Dehalococcoidia bacterium]|nr:hypothetical protein [Dehalococcoidia bacterium]
MSQRRKPRANWGNRMFAVLGLIVILSMVLALVISALQPGT